MVELSSVVSRFEPWAVQTGDALDILRTLPDGCVQCCCTSPPYFGLRDYQVAGQIGLEPTLEEYVVRLVEVFREVRRVLREDGVCWLNLGDSYAATSRSAGASLKSTLATRPTSEKTTRLRELSSRKCQIDDGFKPKDRLGVPHRVVFALQNDGWYWRDEIVWHRPSPMPESVTDRCTKAHEMVFMLTKRGTYFYDQEAIKETATNTIGAPSPTPQHKARDLGHTVSRTSTLGSNYSNPSRNRRSVWTIAGEPFSGAHFAVFPPQLVEPMILAGTSAHGACSKCGSPYTRITNREQLKRSRPNDHVKRTGEEGTGNSCANSVAGVRVETIGWQPSCKCSDASVVSCIVLDPFTGSGTTGMVARQLRRRFIGCELNPEYASMARKRIGDACPLDDAIERNANSESKQTTFFPDD